MDSLKLGTFINCKDLPIEKVSKLLNEFAELAEEPVYDVDSLIHFSEDYLCNLVYGKTHMGQVVIWFWDDNLRCDKEVFYEDIFPEQL